MDPNTVKFLIFVAFSLATFAAGYAWRRKRPDVEKFSRAVHLHTVIWLWSPVTLYAFWTLPLRNATETRDLVTLMLAQPLLMILPAAFMALIVRLMKTSRDQRGVLTLAAALSNHGFTLGAYLCYVMLSPSETAMAYGIAYVTAMQIFMVLIFYPVARHYGPEDSSSIAKLMIGSFLTVRAMPLYLGVVGLVLNLTDVPVPTQINDWRLIDVLFFVAAAGANAGVGMRFRFGDTLNTLRFNAVLAGVQFVLHPLLAVGLMALLVAVGLHPTDLPRHVIILEAFCPTALNTVMVSNLFHLDARLASALWLWNMVIFCVVVLPLVLWIWPMVM
ncbi:MAG: hypothetical protein GC159_09760 [Phycisphaera sp.]|nr:hypothetical protein [Phycisphaera sp.]